MIKTKLSQLNPEEKKWALVARLNRWKIKAAVRRYEERSMGKRKEK